MIRVSTISTAAIESVQAVSTAIAAAAPTATATSTQVVALYPLVLHVATEDAVLVRAATEEAAVGVCACLAWST